MRNLLSSIALFLSATASNAMDLIPDGVALSLGSNHLNATREFEETNPGIFLRFDGEIADTYVGCFRNSFGDNSCGGFGSFHSLSLSYEGFNVIPFAGVAFYPEHQDKAPIEFNGGNIIPIGGVALKHDETPFFVQVFPGSVKRDGYDILLVAGVEF